ncbi:cytochrome P450 [Chroococcus sp. FPU101]|uniref:cytochrome P450 n=1 Tax=Chroococcus sp. FPU101 TaxID=1974212 RepID=UPI001A8D18C0|nr:cytochrome P450 [Chroococcus sp. FPU101]GFE71350.1 cytochrome P450 [Chroococcus sp. FPU101]
MTLPPRPTSPRFLRMFNLVFRPVQYLDQYGQQFGDIFAVGSEEYPFIYVNHPKGIQEIFTADKDCFDSGTGNGVLKFLLGANSITLLDGEAHQRHRKLLIPPFYAERLRAYHQIIDNIAHQVTAKWQEGQIIRVRTDIQEMTLQVILQVVFGLEQGQRYDQLKKLLTILLETLSTPLTSALLFFPQLRQDWGNFSPWGRFLRYKQQVDELLRREIQERRQENNLDKEDILTLLLATKDEDGKPMTDEEIHDELMTMLVAGHETTASALTWALYWVYSLPTVKDKLRFELSSLGENASLSDIAKLPYLGAVCSETLRIYPVAMIGFPRILKKPFDLMGYHFNERTVLSPCVYLVHQREDLYPEPKTFKPERFLQRQYSPYEYFPFGGGSRRCIGMSLAMLEMKLILAAIVSRFELTLTTSRPLQPVRRGLTLAPPANFKLKVKTKFKD